jgi:hypothetical protein
MAKENKMLISDLIKELELIKKEYGDIPCVHSEEHEYWGSVQTHLSRLYNIEVGSGQPDGPKSGVSELCVKFGK